MRTLGGRAVFGIAAAAGVASAVVGGTIAPVVWWYGAALVPVVAVWVAPWRRTPTLPWVLLASGLTLWFAGDLVWEWLARSGTATTVSAADALYLVAYPVLALGLARLVAGRVAGPVRDGVLDGLALTIAAALATWTFLVAPSLEDAGSLGERLTLAAYPFADVVLLAALCWLLLVPSARTPSSTLLAAGLGLTLALDVAWAVVPLLAPGASLEWIDAAYPASYGLLAWAALTRDEERTPAAQLRRLHPARLCFLGAALLTVPIVSLLAPRIAGREQTVVLLGASIALTLIVTARVALVIHARATAEDALEYQATHDTLTGLMNRTMLLDRLEHAVRREHRTNGCLAVLWIDLDDLKATNDTWGHKAGDALLVEAARRLSELTRESDSLARVGGDEFVLVCEDIADATDALGVADRVLETLAHEFDAGGVPMSTTASVGIAVLASEDDTAPSLLGDADAAMYRAKRQGGARAELYDERMRAWAFQRRDTETALRCAIERDELRLLYQPVVSLAGHEVVGFEALVRWERPGHGVLPPDEFVAVAEELGLIVPIGEWVLDEASRQLSTWNHGYPDLRPLTMSVNVSGRQCNARGLAERVQRVITTHALDPAWLTLEITETVMVQHARIALAQLENVKRTGVRIAIDDFGTGYSALAYLRSFPLDELKIDQVFVRELGSLAADTTVVSAVIALGHALGLTVVAEGVETTLQLATLRHLGCDRVQGYLFAAPLTLGEAEVVVRERGLFRVVESAETA